MKKIKLIKYPSRKIPKDERENLQKLTKQFINQLLENYYL